MTILLTDKALRDAGRVEHYSGSTVGYLQIGLNDATEVVRRFLDYHATQGRDELVGYVAAALMAYDTNGQAGPMAETVVAALLGENQ